MRKLLPFLALSQLFRRPCLSNTLKGASSGIRSAIGRRFFDITEPRVPGAELLVFISGSPRMISISIS